jgi:hypothetical protein
MANAIPRGSPTATVIASGWLRGTIHFDNGIESRRQEMHGAAMPYGFLALPQKEARRRASGTGAGSSL